MRPATPTTAATRSRTIFSDAVGPERLGAAVAAAQHPAKQRAGGVSGRRQVAAYRGERGRPDVARGAGPELIGLARPDVHGTAAGDGLGLHVAALQRSEVSRLSAW